MDPSVYLRSHGFVVVQDPLVVACPWRGAFLAGTITGSVVKVVLVRDCVGLEELVNTQRHCNTTRRNMRTC
jgi:hypothetical protein